MNKKQDNDIIEGLASSRLSHIERDVFVSIDKSKIIERFHGYRPRKGTLPRPRGNFSHSASVLNKFYLVFILEGLASSNIEDVVMRGSDESIL